MQTDRNVKLPAELWSRMADAAHAEGKTVEELFEKEALNLLQLRELPSFVATNRKLATERGLTEADVPPLIAESRTERLGRLTLPRMTVS